MLTEAQISEQIRQARCNADFLARLWARHASEQRLYDRLAGKASGTNPSPQTGT
jgi:hypothetical protein